MRVWVNSSCISKLLHADLQLLLAKKEQNRIKREDLKKAQAELELRKEECRKYYSTQLIRLEEAKSEFMIQLVNCRR